MRKNQDFTFQAIVNITLFIVVVLMLMPFVILFMSSIASEKSLVLSGYRFIPREFSLDAYLYIFRKANTIYRSYFITIFITVVGTSVSLILTTMLAYPLSRKDFKRRNMFSFFVYFTMIFNGGLVPSYMMWTRIFGIKNTVYALIIPSLLMNAFNILLMRNYFSSSIPQELIEAAQIDSASEFKIFIKIILPLSLPILATIGLITGLAYWNDWINGLYYISKPELFSIQVLLNRILSDIQFLLSQTSTNISTSAISSIPSVSVRMAIAVLGIIPIMIIFPFFQKYFVKGMTIGAVKG